MVLTHSPKIICHTKICDPPLFDILARSLFVYLLCTCVEQYVLFYEF